MSGEGKPKSILRKSKSVKLHVGETEIELQNGKAETSNHAQDQDKSSSVERRKDVGVVPRHLGQKSLSDIVRTRIASSWYQASGAIPIFIITCRFTILTPNVRLNPLRIPASQQAYLYSKCSSLMCFSLLATPSQIFYRLVVNISFWERQFKIVISLGLQSLEAGR